MQPTVPITPEVLQQVDNEFGSLVFTPVHDLALHGQTLRITGDNGTVQEATMSPDARHYLSQFASVHSNFVDKLDDPQLVELIWNYCLRRRGSDLNVLKAVIRGTEVQSFTTRSFNALPPSQIIQAVQAAIPDAVLERMPYGTNRKATFHITGPDLNEDFQNVMGMATDVHHFSIGVEYDFTGAESPSMRSFGHRHHCGNIMESPYGIGGKQWRIFTTKPEQALEKFTEYARKGVEFVRNTMIPHIRATMEARMEEPQRDIQDLLDTRSVPERVQELVYESYRTEDLGGTMYHLVNALTRAANSDRCPPNWIQRLRQMAGDVTVKHDPSHEPRRCNTCHQRIAAMTVNTAQKEHTH